MRGIQGVTLWLTVMTLAACGGPGEVHRASHQAATPSLPHVSSHLALAAKDGDALTMGPGAEYVLNVTLICASEDGATQDLDLLLDAVKGKPSRWGIKEAASGKLLPATWDGRGFVLHLAGVPGNGQPLSVQLLVKTPETDAPLALELTTTVVTTEDDPRVVFEDATGLELVVAPRAQWHGFHAGDDVKAAGRYPDVAR